MPVTLIVTKCSSSTCYMEKVFVILLENVLRSTTDHVISSTDEFIKRLNNIHFPENYLIASLYVIYLYTSIDTQKAVIIINNCIYRMKNTNANMKTILKTFLNLKINNKYFIFENKVYNYNNGAQNGWIIS